MNIIKWNDISTFQSIFQNIRITPLKEPEFCLTNPKWISKVTTYFGCDNEIENNLLSYFKKKVNFIEAYHATRLIIPTRLKREGLKKLSLERIFKICENFDIKLPKSKKAIIIQNYNKYVSKRAGVRTNIYLEIDKYRNLFNESETQNKACSYYRGSEAISNVLDREDYLKYLQHPKASPVIIVIHLPYTEKFIHRSSMISLANHFFASWYNFTFFSQGQFKCDMGLDIKSPIKSKYVQHIKIMNPNIN